MSRGLGDVYKRQLILEAMKMQNEISSGIDGTVAEVNVSEGDSVEANFLLARIEPEPHG